MPLPLIPIAIGAGALGLGKGIANMFRGNATNKRISGLEDLLKKMFGGELDRMDKNKGPIEDAFMGQALNPGSLYDSASTAAKGKANELFAPGGEIASMIAGARGNSIKNGFSPDSAFGNENSILRAGTKQVSDVFAQNAANLENTRFQGLAGAYGEQNQGRRDLMESLFSGLAGLEQARQANPKKFLGIF